MRAASPAPFILRILFAASPLTASVAAAVFVEAAMNATIWPLAYVVKPEFAVTVSAFAVPPAVIEPAMSSRNSATRPIICRALSLTEPGVWPSDQSMALSALALDAGVLDQSYKLDIYAALALMRFAWRMASQAWRGV